MAKMRELESYRELNWSVKISQRMKFAKLKVIDEEFDRIRNSFFNDGIWTSSINMSVFGSLRGQIFSPVLKESEPDWFCIERVKKFVPWHGPNKINWFFATHTQMLSENLVSAERTVWITKDFCLSKLSINSIFDISAARNL